MLAERVVEAQDANASRRAISTRHPGEAPFSCPEAPGPLLARIRHARLPRWAWPWWTTACSSPERRPAPRGVWRIKYDLWWPPVLSRCLSRCLPLEVPPDPQPAGWGASAEVRSSWYKLALSSTERGKVHEEALEEAEPPS